MSSIVKFGPAHFPIGTVFTLNKDICLGENSGKTFEVKQVIQTYQHEYLVETTAQKDQKFFKGMNYSFHLSHIFEIVSRGSGPVFIDNPNNDQEKNEEVIEMIQKGLSFAKFKCSEHGVCVGKNDIAFFSKTLGQLVWLYGSTQSNAMVSEEKISQIFQKSGFKPRVCDDMFGYMYVINKKVFKNWISKNNNRFLTNVKKYKKEFDQMMSALYDEQQDFDDIVVCQEDSCYMPGDDLND
jgi:hypothetical protein